MKFYHNFNALEDAYRPLVMEQLGVRDVCPRCGGDLSPRVIESWRAGRRIHCAACDWCGTWRTGTVLSRSVLLCSQFWVLMGLFRAGATNNSRIADLIGIHAETVRNWRRWYLSMGGA